jgi:hypothetical protein
MEHESNYMIAEWKERCEAYRAYRSQYIQVMSVAFTVFLVTMSVAVSERTDTSVERALLIGMMLGLTTVAKAHRIARNEIQRIGRRITHLETKLDFGADDPTRLLERALNLTESLCYLGIMVTGAFLYLRW